MLARSAIPASLRAHVAAQTAPPMPDAASASVGESLARASYTDRIAFVVELATRLHIYGTTAQRLEGAIGAIARRLGLRCNPWSNPTGMILSFSDATADSPLLDTTQVIRLEPGSTDLRKLCAADAIAEDVLAGRSDLGAGSAALHALDRPPGRRALALETLSYGLSAASVAGLLRNSWADIAVSGLIGVLIGALHVAGLRRPRLQEAEEAIAALVATLLAATVATFLFPVTTKTVVIASIIVLMPGMMLTNAVSELSSQHLVSGTARFGGALAILLKLTFGTVAATQFVLLLGWHPHEALEHRGAAIWVEALALLVSSYSFAVLFRAHRRDYPLVMASAWLGYGVTRWAGAEARQRRRRVLRQHGDQRREQCLCAMDQPARCARPRAGHRPAGAGQRELPQPDLRARARPDAGAQYCGCGIDRSRCAGGGRAVRKPVGSGAAEPLI